MSELTLKIELAEGKVIELSEQEAHELFLRLEQLFGKPPVFPVPYPYPVCPPEWPYPKIIYDDHTEPVTEGDPNFGRSWSS